MTEHIFDYTALWFGWTLTIGIVLIFAIVAAKMITGSINLADLLSEPGGTGKASMSRFQFFIFTFVIAGLYIVLSIENGQLIEVPESTLALLGISSGSYLISKGIKQPGGTPPPPAPTPPQPIVNPVPGPGPQN